MLDRYLDPATLAAISSLDLVAKTVVDGFVAGIHRSPDFGFSQEFAEYRAYTPGDDLRHVDWNVFARTERAFLKRYRGETNSQLLIMLDSSASMNFGSAGMLKSSYARFLAASFAYLGNLQRDATGIILFDDEVRAYVPPSTRAGQLHRLLHTIEKPLSGKRTDFAKPFLHFQQFLRRRGITVVISDFYDSPASILKTIEPLRYRGNDVALFHILDQQEIQPHFDRPVLLQDLEDDTALEVTPEYARQEYRGRINQHIAELQERARGAGIDYCLMNTSRPLDEGLREYFRMRQRRL